jgi:hypothetical protein
MKTNKILVASLVMTVLLFSVGLSGCACCNLLTPKTTDPPPAAPTDTPLPPETEEPDDEPAEEEPADTPVDTSIGTIERVTDVVQQNEDTVRQTNLLFQDDEIRITDGGEGELDFGGELILRMFNDTQTGGVRVGSAPGTPLDVRLFLDSGGFTGQLIEPGSRAEFQTPNDATIIVYGTDFFIVYDEENDITSVGNWEGEIVIELDGVVIEEVQPNTIIEIYHGGEYSDPIPFDFSMREFESLARENESPVLALWALLDESRPEIEVLGVDPDTIWIGKHCPDNPGTTQLTVEVFDDIAVREVYATWWIGDQREEVLMEQVDDFTFTATIGPVTETGELSIIVIAEDYGGNKARTKTIRVPVHSCIG